MKVSYFDKSNYTIFGEFTSKAAFHHSFQKKKKKLAADQQHPSSIFAISSTNKRGIFCSELFTNVFQFWFGEYRTIFPSNILPTLY